MPTTPSGASRQACHAGGHAGRATQSRTVREFLRHPARTTARSTSSRRRVDAAQRVRPLFSISVSSVVCFLRVLPVLCGLFFLCPPCRVRCGAGFLACGRLSSRPWPLYPPPSAQPNAVSCRDGPACPPLLLRSPCPSMLSKSRRRKVEHAARLAMPASPWSTQSCVPRRQSWRRMASAPRCPALGRKLSLWASLFLWCRHSDVGPAFQPALAPFPPPPSFLPHRLSCRGGPACPPVVGHAARLATPASPWSAQSCVPHQMFAWSTQSCVPRRQSWRRMASAPRCPALGRKLSLWASLFLWRRHSDVGQAF